MSRLVERLVGRPLTDEEKLTAGVVLTLTFMVFEGAFAIVAGSLAMLGDAAHMLSDAASFAVSLAALRVARRGPTMRHTYGLARVEVVGALASTLALWAVTGGLVYEAFCRIHAYVQGNAKPVDGKLMVILGCFGVLTNVAMERILGAHSHGFGGHDHGHGHSHGHGHGHKDDHACCDGDHGHNPLHGDALASYRGAGAHGHDAAHGHGSGHDHEAHGHGADAHGHGSGHDHGDCCDEDHGHEAHGHKEHDHSEHGHKGHDHDCCDEDHGHSEHSHESHGHKGHDHDCCDEDHGHSDHGHKEESHGHGSSHGHDAAHDHGSARAHEESKHDIEHGHSDHRTPLHSSKKGYSAIPTQTPPPKTKKRQMNIDAAYLHVLGDLLQNLGVILAGAVIWWRPTWQVADPLVTLFFALIVVRTTMGFMGKAVNILLEGAPANVDIGGLKKGLEDVEGVGDVHDIHVWELTADRPAMSCHVVLAPGATHDEVLMRCQDVCADDFDIDHATIQVQASHCRARTCCSQEHMSPDMGGRPREDSLC